VLLNIFSFGVSAFVGLSLFNVHYVFFSMFFFSQFYFVALNNGKTKLNAAQILEVFQSGSDPNAAPKLLLADSFLVSLD
jgi:hypothetical protein